MKKILLVLIFCVGLLIPSNSHPNLATLQEQITREVVRQHTHNSAVRDSKLAPAYADVEEHTLAAMMALFQSQYVVLPKNYPAEFAGGRPIAREITWDVFEREARKQTMRQEAYYQKQHTLTKIISQFLSPEQIATIFYQIQSGPADYGELLKGKKYIYVAESSNHDTKSIPQEGIRLLEQVRKNNPNARILFALEMANLILDQSNVALIPAGHWDKSILISGEYTQLAQVALGQERMDLLALDDVIFLQQGTLNYLKIGDTAIRFDITAPHIKNLLKRYPKSTDFPILCVYDFLSRSEWGVAQRNNQWMRYIKAVEKYYDIIIVYAGSAHLDNAVAKDTLPTLLAKDGILVSIFSQEKIAEQSQQFYDCANNTQCIYKTSATLNLTEEEFAISQAFSQKLLPYIKKLDEQGIPFFIEERTEEEMESLAKQYLTKQQEQQIIDKFGNEKKDFTITRMSVFLPK